MGLGVKKAERGGGELKKRVTSEFAWSKERSLRVKKKPCFCVKLLPKPRAYETLLIV
jgi:hypothetical protein